MNDDFRKKTKDHIDETLGRNLILNEFREAKSLDEIDTTELASRMTKFAKRKNLSEIEKKALSKVMARMLEEDQYED